MVIKDRLSGLIMRSNNDLVIEQWKKQGYSEYEPEPKRAEPEQATEQKPRRTRKKTAEE